MTNAATFKQGTRSGTLFQDTITANLSGNGSTQTWTWAPNSLLPSLSDRNVVFKSIKFEVIPLEGSKEENTGLLYYVPPFETAQVATGPYKLLSAVNPTYFNANIDRLKQLAPGCVTVASSDSTSAVISFRVGVAPPTGNDYRVRITTLVHVFPQQEAITA